jgi:hypothetical protein
MRSHFWYYLIDGNGKPISNANVDIYLAGTDEKAYVYLSETGGSASTETIITDNDGFFEFWISGYSGDEHYYTSNKKFRITWDKPGISFGEIDNVDFISNISTASVFRKDDIEAADWEVDVGGYKLNVVHNLDILYPMVICYDYNTGRQVNIIVESVNEFEVNIYCNTAQNSCVTIIG